MIRWKARELLRDLGFFSGMPVIMDRVYEGNETREVVLALASRGFAQIQSR